MTKETYFGELSFALRRRELLPRPVEEDGLLPVEWNGRVLCRVTEAAGTIMKYMKLLETAPPLKAESLADGYRVLAEFNGTVLAGKRPCWGLNSSPGPGTMTGEASATATTTWRTTKPPRRTSPSAPG